METIQQQLNALQTSVKRQRLLNIALLGVIVAGGFITAVRPAVDANFDKITCKGWKVVDAHGKERITARTDLDSNSRPCAGISWFDKSGAERISASKYFLALARHAGKAKSYQISEASKRDVAELRALAANDDREFFKSMKEWGLVYGFIRS